MLKITPKTSSEFTLSFLSGSKIQTHRGEPYKYVKKITTTNATSFTILGVRDSDR